MPGVLIGILIGLAGVAAIIWVCFGIQNHFDEAARRARAEDITEALNDAEEQFLHWRRLFQSNSLSVPVFLCSARLVGIIGARRYDLLQVLHCVVRHDSDKALVAYANHMLDTMPFFGESYRNMANIEDAIKYCDEVVTWCQQSNRMMLRLTRDKKFRREWLADRAISASDRLLKAYHS